MDVENMVFNAHLDLPDDYQVQMMVLKDYPGGKRKRGLKLTVYRSRLWIGLARADDPIAHASQEHEELRVAIDACYSMLLALGQHAITSPAAIEAVKKRVHHYFSGLVGSG